MANSENLAQTIKDIEEYATQEGFVLVHGVEESSKANWGNLQP